MSASNQTSSEDIGDFVFVAKIDNARILSNVLQTLVYKKDTGQLSTISFSANGVKFTVEEGKSFQGSVVLEQELFNEFRCTRQEDKEEFKLNLSILLDCLQIYGTTSSYVAFQMAYEGYGHPLLLMLDDNGVTTSCALKTLEAEKLTDFRFRTEKVIAKVIVEAEYLKEAFNELDWSSPLITFTISNNAPYFRLTTSGPSGSCQVDYPKESEVFELFECEDDCIFSYKLSLLQPAVKALSSAQKTQLRINKSGVLSMQHMIRDEEKNISFVDFLIGPCEDSMDE